MTSALPYTLIVMALLMVSGCGGKEPQLAPRESTGPLEAWQRTVAAMRAADRLALRRLTNDAVNQQLTSRPTSRPASDADLRLLGENWSQWQVRVESDTGKDAVLKIGPPIKEHTLHLSKRDANWIVTAWIPGG